MNRLSAKIFMNIDYFLYFTVGALLPFPTIGYGLATDLTISPSLVAASALLFQKLPAIARDGTALRFALMLFIFALTAIGRFPPSSYLPSLVMLAMASSAIVIAPHVTQHQRSSLIIGYMIGLNFTIFLVFVEYFALKLNQNFALDFLDSVFEEGRRGDIYNGFRPRAGFFEPSHLAIYLGTSLYIISQIYGTISIKLFLYNIALATAILATNSLSGVITAAAAILAMPSFYFKTYYKVPIIVFSFAILALSEFSGESFGQRLIDRFDSIVYAYQNNVLTGSEGSRVNVFGPVVEFWRQNEISGFLFGTGYSNYSDWLVKVYGDLGQFSSAGRGQIDNYFASILLSTGFIGLFSYASFVIYAVRNIAINNRMRILIVYTSIAFCYGHIVSYLAWHILFILLMSNRAFADSGLIPTFGARA